MAEKDLLKSRLNELNKNKEALKGEKPNVIRDIAKEKDATEPKPDFLKMAEVLKKQQEKVKSENDGYVKDTIYIRADLYEAMQALCLKQGDKKKFVNEAYEAYLSKKYKQVMNDK